jgi:8-oxo-dGTP pyrophosphatase MutT (NUDIX family)
VFDNADGVSPKATPRQVAVIAVRKSDGDVEVCLIRRKDTKTWGIPKGFIDRGDSPEQAALTEAVEEAGLRGEIVGEAVGVYDYEKRDEALTVAVYLMKVAKEQKEWLEMKFRERKWFSLDEAAEVLPNHPVWPLWGRITDRLNNRDTS